MAQQPLFIGAPVALAINARFVAGDGWTVTTQMRRDYQEWSDSPPEQYSELSAREMQDVLEVIAWRLLDL